MHYLALLYNNNNKHSSSFLTLFTPEFAFRWSCQVSTGHSNHTYYSKAKVWQRKNAMKTKLDKIELLKDMINLYRPVMCMTLTHLFCLIKWSVLKVWSDTVDRVSCATGTKPSANDGLVSTKIRNKHQLLHRIVSVLYSTKLW